MADLAIKAVAENKTFYYREEHEWKGLKADDLAWFTDQLQNSAKKAKAAGGKEDANTLTLTLTGSVSGTAMPQLVVKGVSRIAFIKLQRHAHHQADALLKMGEALARK